jgi:hypothetical protein
MPKLSLIESEAARFVGHVPEAKRRMLQDALINLCEIHWPEIRGPEPDMPLAHALWEGAPPLADLLADLYAAGDERLDGVLQGRKPAQGFALLALAEIERGDAEGARLAHEPMMLFDSPSAGTLYAEGIAAALRGTPSGMQLHLHESKPALWKALATIAANIGRCDLNAVLRVIGLLAARAAPEQTADEMLEQLREKLDGLGVQFLGIDDHHVSFEIHGHEHKPVSTRQLGEMLVEIRQAWLS